jgi:hypothetical protein|mmetsp:Transcript_113666/g.177834  ORF Transcript_113666/g.177834 Transcript_113666/m.177834 type:complete len:377 (+) Transcript_113666:43-1173(+)
MMSFDSDTQVGDIAVDDIPSASPKASFTEASTIILPESSSACFTDARGKDDSRGKDVKALARRIRNLESRQQSVEERFVKDHLANPGPTQAQWSHMQEEMERVRRLFEFIESAMPHDAAEAMRFFRRAWNDNGHQKEPSIVASSSKLIGFEGEFERHKKQVDADVAKFQASMHQEVSNCMQVIKSLQRDVDIARGALLVERPRWNPDANEAGRTSSMAAGDGRHLQSGMQTVEDGGKDTRSEAFDIGAGQLVSRQSLELDIASLREEIKGWFEDFSENVKDLVRPKADRQQAFTNTRSEADLHSRRAPQSCSTPFDPDKAQRKNWRPLSSPGIHQLRAPGANFCGPKSLPKFTRSSTDDKTIRPFGYEPVKALRQR